MNETTRRTSRRWFQVSLRSILLLMLVVAAYFAGYRTAAHQTEQAKQGEREAARSADEAKALRETFVASYMQAVAASNASVAQTTKSLAELEAKLLWQEREFDREVQPELIEPVEK